MIDFEQRIAYLEREVAFWKEQQHFAASVAATIADLDEVAPALRQLLRQERTRRKAAEREVVILTYRLQQVAEGLVDRSASDRSET